MPIQINGGPKEREGQEEIILPGPVHIYNPSVIPGMMHVFGPDDLVDPGPPANNAIGVLSPNTLPTLWPKEPWSEVSDIHAPIQHKDDSFSPTPTFSPTLSPTTKPNKLALETAPSFLPLLLVALLILLSKR